MSTLTDCRFSLDQATAGTQKEKGGLIRCLQPSTGAPLHSGRTTRDVWRTLDEQSLSIGYRVFQVTLCRARTSKSPTAPGCREKDNKPVEGQRLPKGEVQRRRGHDQAGQPAASGCEPRTPKTLEPKEWPVKCPQWRYAKTFTKQFRTAVRFGLFREGRLR